MEIDLHFDALDSITHKGNHDQPWAYEGGRINEELFRVVEAMSGKACLKEIYRPPSPASPTGALPPKKKPSLFDLLFKSM